MKTRKLKIIRNALAVVLMLIMIWACMAFICEGLEKEFTYNANVARSVYESVE